MLSLYPEICFICLSSLDSLNSFKYMIIFSVKEIQLYIFLSLYLPFIFLSCLSYTSYSLQ